MTPGPELQRETERKEADGTSWPPNVRKRRLDGQRKVRSAKALRGREYLTQDVARTQTTMTEPDFQFLPVGVVRRGSLP
jgi:hypothetical protein